jgi:2-(1,2-epoxy-1,2-dihydrophenyl)acetyl-CoA isomerase
MIGNKGVAAVTLSELTRMECGIEDGLAHVVLNSPERGNPIDGAFAHELKAVADLLSDHTGVRAVLITARGRFFSVGGDIRAFAEDRAALPGIIRAWTSDLHAAIVRLMRMQAPVVTAVHGNVAGGSVSFAAAADIVYAAKGVKFSAAFPGIGFNADSGSTVTLPQRMGFSRAKRFLMMAETLDADAARDAGLVDFVTSPETLFAEAEAAAKRFASGATRAYGGIKQTMLRARMQGVETQLEDEAETLARVSQSDDAWEGITAFLEKRKAAFRGR